MKSVQMMWVLVALAMGLGVTQATAGADGPEQYEAERDRNAQESRRERRRRRRRARRARWSEAERERQETERERLRAETARAEADRAEAEAEAERLRRQGPVIRGHRPVIVTQFAFDARAAARSSAEEIRPGFMPDPRVLRGHAAGRMSSRHLALPEACPGFWTRQPQHYVSLPQAMRYFRAETHSDHDTTLAIVTPSGQVWCDDDGAGNLDARLEGEFPAGTYAVYVGTYQQGRRANYELHLSELSAEQAPPTSAAATHPVQTSPPHAPNCRSEVIRAGHHASNLRHCEGAEPFCAQAVLQGAHHPTNLRHCRGAVRPRCATSLIAAGHHPTNLRHCAGVDDECAEALLRRGSHPTQLRHCR